MVTESLLARRQIVERKLSKVTAFLTNSADPDNTEWMSQRVKKGESRATGYIISKELERNDFMAFARNAARVARMNQTLKVKASELQDLLDGIKSVFGYIIEPEDSRVDFGNLKEKPIIRNYLDVTPELKRQVVEPFLESPIAQRILTVAANYQPADESENSKFSNSFVGAIWEYIAYYYLKGQLTYQQFLLPPWQTFLLYRNIYADRKATSNYGLNFGITNRTFPDGLIIEKKEDHLSVEAAVEYKSSTRMPPSAKRIERQIISFRNGQLSRDLKLEGPEAIDPLFHSGLISIFNPGFPKDKPLRVNPNSQVFLVLPENSKVDLAGAYNRYLPFTGAEFGTFIDVLKNALRYNNH